MNTNSYYAAYQQAIKAIDRKDWDEALDLLHTAITLCSSLTVWQLFLVRAWVSIQLLAEDDDEDWASEQRIIDDLVIAEKESQGESPDVAALLGYAHYANRDLTEALPRLLHCLGHSSLTSANSVISYSDLVDILCDTLAGILEGVEEMEDAADALAKCDEYRELLDSIPLKSPFLTKSLAAEVLASKVLIQWRSGNNDAFQETYNSLSAVSSDHPRLKVFEEEIEKLDRTEKGIADALDFSKVAGSDQAGTFSNELRRIYKLHFSEWSLGLDKVASILGSEMGSYLLHGPSGCGKTYVINAFANQHKTDFGHDLPVIRMRINDMMSKWVGESEKALTDVINEAIDRAPCILFADEIDGLGQGRNSSGQDWRNTQVAHFLQELDRLRESKRKVLFFASTNHLHLIDLAMLRRFDEMIAADMPDEKVRKSVFQIHIASHPEGLRPKEIDWNDLLKTTHGLTPGDIEKAVRTAFKLHLGEILDSESIEATPLPYRVLSTAVKQQDTYHIREWLSQTIKALQDKGYKDKAEEVEEKYRDYVPKDEQISVSASSSVVLDALPTDVWDETPVYN